MKINEVISGKAGVEGVRWALLGRPARKVLRACLASLLAAEPATDMATVPATEPMVQERNTTIQQIQGIRLGDCRLTRAKFKPGRKLTAYYSVNLVQDSTSNNGKGRLNSRPIAVTWTSPSALDLQKGLESWVEMQSEAWKRGLVAPFHQLWSESPPWGMRFQVYPLDTHFPNLVRLADPQHARQLLADLGSAASEVSVTPIRYRPGQRHVLRYEPGVRSPGSWVFVKLYPDPEEGARSFRVANRIVSWLEEYGGGVNGVRPLGYQNTDAAIFYPEVAGAPLSRYLRKFGKEVEQSLRLAGRALRSLHRSTGLAEELEPVSFSDEVRATARAAEHISPLLPEAGQKIEQLLENVQELYVSLPQEEFTFTHSDFKSDHLWVSASGKLTLIDFDTCAIADPAADVGKFLADLRWWFSLYKNPDIENARVAFLSGYSSGDLKDRLARAKLYEALVLTKITARRVPLFDRSWGSRTMELLCQAEQIFVEENLLKSGG